MNNLQVIELRGKRVLTTSQLAESYETTGDKISYNFNYNKGYYQEGKHYFELTGEELKKFKETNREFQGSINKLYLWTEKGALLHAKSLNTDKAWDVYDELIEGYYKAIEQVKILTEKEQLEVMMKHTLLQSEETKALKSEVERVASDVEYLKNNTRIDSYQETQIARMVNVSVFTALGGKESNAYTELGKTTFSACNGEFKKYFSIPRRGELPRIKFDEACEFIGSWKPSTALSTDIKKCNSQQTLDWLENL